VDPVADQVARAAGHGTFEARVGDARDLAGAGLRDGALTLARALSTTPGVTDMSQHVLAIGTVTA
jgi:hypothetical protein